MANMEPAGRHEPPGSNPIPSYDIEASNLEHFFTGFLDLVYSNRGAADVQHNWHQHNAILVMNPSKMRMSPLTAGKGVEAVDFFADWRRWAGGGGVGGAHTSAAGLQGVEGQAAGCAWRGATAKTRPEDRAAASPALLECAPSCAPSRVAHLSLPHPRPHAPARAQFDLDKLRRQEGGYVYRYKYHGAGASATWISQHNFAVIDVSAGPCHYGPVSSRAGAVMPQALPEVQVRGGGPCWLLLLLLLLLLWPGLAWPGLAVAPSVGVHGTLSRARP
jgi:hypothetical protein